MELTDEDLKPKNTDGEKEEEGLSCCMKICLMLWCIMMFASIGMQVYTGNIPKINPLATTVADDHADQLAA